MLLGTLDEGTVVTIEVSTTTHTLRRVSYVAALPARGYADVVWWYEDYREIDGLGLVPFRYGSSLDGHDYLDMTVDSVVRGALGLLDVPAGFRTTDTQTVFPDATSPPLLWLEEIAPGVSRVPKVRSGFAPLVVEFDSFVVAVDAPASFPLLGQIPAGETDPGRSMSWVSERFVDAIREALPTKPIGFLVLTHFHEDHAGGVRAFVAEGATVIASPSARAGVERTLALPADIVHDRYARHPARLRFEAVDSVRIIDDGTRRLEIIAVGENPHTDGMLVAYLPAERIMFVSDLVTPARLDAYPRASHAALDRAFARWLSRRQLDPDAVIAMHGAGPLTRDHLAKLSR